MVAEEITPQSTASRR